MMFLLKNYMKGLVIAWLTTLVMYIAKRILARVFQDYGQPNSPPRTTTSNDKDIIDTLWIGMSEQQLRQLYGSPNQRHSGTRDDYETWIYAPFHHHKSPLTVTLKHKKVTGWSFDTAGYPALT